MGDVGRFETACLALLGIVVAGGIAGAVLSPRSEGDRLGTQGAPPASLQVASGAASANVTLGEGGATDQRAEVSLDEIAAGAAVPRIPSAGWQVEERPAEDAQKRRDAFIRWLLPAVLLTNEALIEERKRLWGIHQEEARGERTSAEDRLWLSLMSDRYRTPPNDIDELFRRLDAVPPSIVIATVGVVSRWGAEMDRSTLAFLMEWRGEGKARSSGRQSRQAPALRGVSAGEIADAIVSLVNEHPAYRNFRLERERLRQLGLPLTGTDLAEHLPRSGPGMVPGSGVLVGVIDSERCGRFDGARLELKKAV